MARFCLEFVCRTANNHIRPCPRHEYALMLYANTCTSATFRPLKHQYDCVAYTYASKHNKPCPLHESKLVVHATLKTSTSNTIHCTDLLGCVQQHMAWQKVVATMQRLENQDIIIENTIVWHLGKKPWTLVGCSAILPGSGHGNVNAWWFDAHSHIKCHACHRGLLFLTIRACRLSVDTLMCHPPNLHFLQPLWQQPVCMCSLYTLCTIYVLHPLCRFCFQLPPRSPPCVPNSVLIRLVPSMSSICVYRFAPFVFPSPFAFRF